MTLLEVYKTEGVQGLVDRQQAYTTYDVIKFIKGLSLTELHLLQHSDLYNMVRWYLTINDCINIKEGEK